VRLVSELKHFPESADPRDVADELRRSGAVIVDEIAPPALMDQLDVEAASYIDSTIHGRDEYDGRHTRRTGMLIARCPAARSLVMHPMATGVAGDFLSHASTVQLHLTQLISIEPGETQQKLHRDQMAFDMFDFPSDYHVQCNTMWALTDFTADNGATHLIPGSSTIADDVAITMEECRAEMRRGSVLFYDGKVIHGGGANQSDGVRRGVNITYSVGWVRQEENQFLATPVELARTLDDDLLRMMGYQQGAFALGYVGDNQDPLAFLRGQQGKVKTIGSMADGNDRYRDFANDATIKPHNPD
jgi:ectoine hydroxylase-related dioxygenase (phytanoyl-CoA dioxygenase family)